MGEGRKNVELPLEVPSVVVSATAAAAVSVWFLLGGDWPSDRDFLRFFLAVAASRRRVLTDLFATFFLFLLLISSGCVTAAVAAAAAAVVVKKRRRLF